MREVWVSSRRMVLAVVVLVWGWADRTVRAEKPAAFPSVELFPESQPIYAAIGIDAWDPNRVAYLLFDGNLNRGYTRMYLWVPEDREYNPPKAQRANVDQDFRGFEFTSRSADGREQALIHWQFRHGQRSHGGYFDYATGTRVERDTRVYPVIQYSFGFGVAPRVAAIQHLARMPLSLSIPGEFPNRESWGDVRRVSRPWAELDFYMHRAAQRERRRAVVRFQGRLQHRSHPGHIWRDVTVVSLPPGAICSLTVRPYMQAPVFSESIPVDVAFGAGKVVDLPFAWYEYDWKFESPGLTVRLRDDHRVTLSPQPLGPFDFE